MSDIVAWMCEIGHIHLMSEENKCCPDENTIGLNLNDLIEMLNYKVEKPSYTSKIKNLLKIERVLQETKQDDRSLKVLPILHNNGMIILQFNGWSINLYDDGVYIWEATDGG